jgi:hypothetical protein
MNGWVAVSSTQLEPSKVQVSLYAATTALAPPVRTTLPPRSNMSAVERAGGELAGDSFVQIAPSNDQVSFR